VVANLENLPGVSQTDLVTNETVVLLVSACAGASAEPDPPNRQKAPPFSTPGELVRQVTGQVWPTWPELAEHAGRGDYAGYRA